MSNETIYKIRRAKNGYVLTVQHEPNEPEEMVCQEKESSEEDSEIEIFADFLRELVFNFGPMCNKRSKKRIYVNVLPGYSYEGGLEKEYRAQLQELKETCEQFLTREGQDS